MGMGLVTEEEFESQLTNVTQQEIERPKVHIPVVIEELPSKGRKDGDNNTPESLRNLIGMTSNVEGRQEALALANAFGVSPSSVSAYANGSRSTKTYHESDNKILNAIRQRKDRLTKRALNKLGSSLEKITDDKLDELDAKELASVSKDMAAVVKSMEPSNINDSDGRPNVAFVLYKPEIRREESFDSIQVSE